MKKSLHESRSTLHVPRVLVSNDDGINAPGLKSMERIARSLSKDVWVVAPEVEQSGAAHSLTLHVPVRVRKISAKRFAVSGTPTDCVLLGLMEIIPSSCGPRSGSTGSRADGDPAQPAARRMTVDLVLSGVNRGSNVGDDVTYSGTVAAAMEGAILGVPSIAFSQNGEYNSKIHWPTAERHAPALIKKLLAATWPKNTLININFPDCTPDKVKGIKLCAQGKRVVNVSYSERVDPKGRPYFWIGGERQNETEKQGVDIDFLEAGYITVTPLNLDLTDYKTMAVMRKEWK